MDCSTAIAKYTVLTLLQNLFIPVPFRNMPSVLSFTAQPVTLKVPKDQINDLKQAIQANPGYLKQLLSQSAGGLNGIGQPISLPPSGVGATKGLFNTPSLTNGYPSVGQNPVTVALPKVTTIGGQQFYLTSRLNLLWDRGVNLLKKTTSAIASPLSTLPTPTGYFNNAIGLNGINQGNVPNKKPNTNISEEDSGDDDKEEEEEEEEEEIQNTKKPKYREHSNKNNVRRHKNKTKYDSSPEENSKGESSSEEEEEEEEQSEENTNDNKNKNGRSPTKKRDESTASVSGSGSVSESGSVSGSASGSASDETNS